MNIPPAKSAESEEEAYAFAKKRLARAQQSFPHSLNRKEDKIPKTVGKLADPREKLRAILKLADELAGPLSAFTPCKKGCASCCRMGTINLSKLEAEEISAKTGVKMAHSPKRDHTFEPCPFLQNEACSIYEHRPFLCRTHMVFNRTAFWCDPGKCDDTKMPKIAFPNLLKVYIELPKGEIYDIREIFPPNQNKEA